MQCLDTDGCGYCNGQYSGVFGCYAGGMKGPNNMSVCDEMDNGDEWISMPDGCEDPCIAYNNGYCEACITEEGCGWCQDGGECRTGTESGPWSDQISYCTEWRWYSDNYTIPELCSAFVNCSWQAEGCADCTANYASLGQPCHYCESGSKGTCIFPYQNCSSSTDTIYTNYTDCPATTKKGSASTLTASMMMICGLLGLLTSLA